MREDTKFTSDEREFLLKQLKEINDVAQAARRELIQLRSEVRNTKAESASADADQSQRIETFELKLELKSQELQKQIATQVELAILRLEKSERTSHRNKHASNVGALISLATALLYLLAQLYGVKLPTFQSDSPIPAVSARH